MALIIVVSGFAIYKPTQLYPLPLLFGGYQGARLVHFWMTIGLLLFFVVHVLQVVRSGWGNFRSMVTGYVIERDAPTPPVDPADDPLESVREGSNPTPRRSEDRHERAASHPRGAAPSPARGRTDDPDVGVQTPLAPIVPHRRRRLGAAYLGWRWLQDQPDVGGIPKPLRDPRVQRDPVEQPVPRRSAPEFSVSKATPIQVNGRIGIRNEIDLADWTVRVEGPTASCSTNSTSPPSRRSPSAT
jgi:hypothetical protein